MKINTQKTFNEEAKIYEQTSRAVNIYFDEGLNTLIKNIKIRKQNIRILDVCSGTGILTELVAKKFPKAEIVGVDFAKNMLDIAVARLKNYNFTPYCFDILDKEKMQNLGKFDLIISSCGIHNIHTKKQKQIAINNVVNLLKENGFYITLDYLKGNSKKEIEHFREFQYNYLLKSYSKKEANEWMKLLAEEDEPETLSTNLKMLGRAGLKTLKLIWQKEYMGIWAGTK